MEALAGEKLRVASLLQRFYVVTNFREPWRVAHSPPEMLLLSVRARSRQAATAPAS